MDCGRYLELLSARLDGALSGPEERELEAHLGSCPACRAAGAQFAALRSAFTELEEIPAPEGFTQNVMDRVQGSEPKKAIPLFRRPSFKVFAGLAACAVLAVGLYSAVCRPGQRLELEPRGFSSDALEEDGNVSSCENLRSFSDVSITAAGADTPIEEPEPPLDPQKSVPDAVVYDAPLPGVPMSDTEVLVVDRMPEGGWELISPDTPGAVDGLYVTGELLEQINQMAQDQGITASMTSGTEEAELHLIVVLEEIESDRSGSPP